MAAARGYKVWVWIAVVAVLGIVAFFPVAIATDRSTFCRTCHEMVPYYDAWAAGPHAQDAQCVECHVDPGLPARFAHKFVALGEVVAHFSGDTSFPRATPPDVPDARCIRCHDALPKTTDRGFSHEVHAEKGQCVTCHAATGHDVTTEALKAAGIFNASVETTTKPGEFATVDGGAANIKGHIKVACSRCHDMAKTGCPRCHKTDSAKHPWKGDCTECHKAGEKFAFTHPGAADCERCHKPGDKHFKPASGKLAACKTCHTETSGDWKFNHPNSRADCAGCHKAPAKHYAGQCSECHHRTGDTWDFRHPAIEEHSWKGQPCATCHPKTYTEAYCTCHGGNAPKDD